MKLPYSSPTITLHTSMFTTPESQNLSLRFIIALTLDRQAKQIALRELLAIWDRRDESGWTAADAKKLDEIRKLVER
jgi:hypothetical protein